MFGKKNPEKKFIALPNGETYAYLDQGEGEVFLLIHGNSSSSMHFLPLYRRMKNVRLVAPDLRGFGDSSYNAHFSSLEELAQDVKLFADALGISKARIVGWSNGGGISFELAVKHPDFAKSLFLIESAGYRGYPLFKKKPDGTFEPFASKEELAADTVLIAPVLNALENKNAFFIDILWKSSIYRGKKPSAKDNKLYIAETLKQRNLVDLDWALIHFNMSGEHNGYSMGTGKIGNVRCPVAFTSGDLDKVVPPETVRENASIISNSQVLNYKKCGHSPLVDCPDRLVKDILAHAGLN